MKWYRRLKAAVGIGGEALRLEFREMKPTPTPENVAYVRTAKVGRHRRFICPDWDDATDVFDE